MGKPLVVELGLKKSDFTTNAEAARQDMVKFSGAVAQTDAELKAMQRTVREAGASTDAQVNQIKKLETALGSYRQALRTATAEHTAFLATAPTPASAPGGGGGGEGHGHGGGMVSARQRNQELSHSTRAVTDMLMAGQSPLMALQMEAPRLVQAFGGGLGTIMGVGAAVAGLSHVISKTIELTEQAKVLKREYQEALAMPTSGASSPEALRGHVKQIDAALSQDAPVDGLFKRIGQFVSDRFSKLGKNLDEGKLVTDDYNFGGEREERVKSAEDGRKARLQEIVAAEKQLNDLKARGVAEGEESVRVDMIRLQTTQKIAALEEEMGLPKLRVDLANARTPEQKERFGRELTDKEASFQGQKTQLERGGQMEVAAQVLVESLTVRRLALEKLILDIKKLGANVEVRSAEARLVAAQTTLKNGPKKGDVHDANENAVEAAEIEVAAAERAHAARGAELHLEERLLEIRRAGADVEVKSAAARLAAARTKLTTGLQTGETHDANVNAVGAAELEVDAAKRTTAERKVQIDLAQKLAGMRGTQAEKEMSDLKGQAKLLRDRLTPGSPTYEPNEETRDDIERRQLPENKARRRALHRANTGRAFERREEDIKAGEGVGVAEKLRALDALLAVNRDRQQDNKGHEKDPDVESRLKAQAGELLRTKQEITAQEKESLAALGAQTAALANQGYQLDANAKKAQIAARYKPRIDKENAEGNPDKARALEAERDAEKFNADVEEASMTSAQKRERAEHNRKRERAERRAANAPTPEAGTGHGADEAGTGHGAAEAGTGHGAAESPDNVNIPDNADIPDNLTIPDNAGMNFGDIGKSHMPDRRVDPAAASPKPAAAADPAKMHTEMMVTLKAIEKNCTFQEQGT